MAQKLVDAVKQGDLARVTKLAAARRGLNAPDPDDDMTPLQWAADLGHVDIVRVLLSVGASMDGSLFSPLQLAIQGGHQEVIDLLLAHMAGQPDREASLTKALATAAFEGRSELVESLVKAGADPNGLGMKSTAYVPLYQAVIQGKDKGVSDLVRAGANPNLAHPSEFQKRPPVFFLKARSVDLVLPQLKQSGADLNIRDAQGMTPLIAAAASGDVVVARSLLAAGANPSIADLHGNVAMDYARWYENSHPQSGPAEIMPLLQAAGVEGRPQLVEMIHAAAIGDASQVAALLKAGVQPDARGPYGTTALLCASANGHLDVVELLLNQRADPNQTRGESNNMVTTPLIAAAQAGHLAVVQRLVQAGADPNARRMANEPNSTALNWAADSARRSVVEFLMPLTKIEKK